MDNFLDPSINMDAFIDPSIAGANLVDLGLDLPALDTLPEVPTNALLNLPSTEVALVPVTNIKTEVGLEQVGIDTGGSGPSRPNSAVDGSEEAIPSPTTGTVESQPINPWLIVKCIFCNITLTPAEEPKLMECLHAACGNCITTKMSEQHSGDLHILGESGLGLLCPQCLVPCQSVNIIENHFLSEAVLASSAEPGAEAESRLADLKCGSCPDTQATSWCIDCAEFICDGCVLAHQRLKITKEHTIKPKEEGELDALAATRSNAQHKGSAVCSVHRQERLSLFCETCDRMTCRDCQLSEHRDHKYKFVDEIAAETRAMIAGLLSEVSYKRVLLKSAMKVIDDRQSLIVEKKKQLVKEITNMVVKLTNTINARGKQLVVRLNEVCDGKQRTLNEKRTALEQLSALTDHCIDFVNMALSRGSDMALLFSKTNLTSHLQRIKSRRADIPNPEIPVRINLALDKVPDLIKVASTIGAIIVDGRIYPPQVGGGGGGGRQYASPPVQQQQHQQPPAYPQAPAQARGGVSPLQGLTQLNQRTATYHRPQGHHQQAALKQGGGGQLQQGGQQQVTSTTHPYNSGHVDLNLRGLLAPHQQPPHQHQNGYGRTGGGGGGGSGQYRGSSSQLPPPLPPQTSRYLQHAAAYSPHAQLQTAGQASGRQHANYNAAMTARQLVQRVQSPHSSNHQAGIQWHIPQQPGSPALKALTPTPPPVPDDSYKITLPMSPHLADVKPVLPAPAFVSSSQPQTPSPRPPNGKQDDAEKSLDKFCQADNTTKSPDSASPESVNDLMMTIAKLDSNGIMVIPEKGADSMVDSSTGPSTSGTGVGGGGGVQTTPPTSQGSLDSQKDDPNEDWCAVCLDGGEPVLCCDNCPKVFHLKCHIPALDAFPGESETWQCLLCTSMTNLTASIKSDGGDKSGGGGADRLDRSEQQLMQRLLLELYCQYEPSLHFREAVPPENVEYHTKIKQPMCFDTIRSRLASEGADRYRNIYQVVEDIRLVFRNAYAFNPKESQVYSDAKSLEEFLEMLLEKWVPELAYDCDDTASNGEPEAKRARRSNLHE